MSDMINFTEWLEKLRANVAQTVDGVVLRGARTVQVGSSTNGTPKATTSPSSLVGFALRNTSAVVSAEVLLRDGDADGDIVIPLTLAPSESVRDWFGPGGINLTHGLYVDVSAGAIDGAVFLRGVE